MIAGRKTESLNLWGIWRGGRRAEGRWGVIRRTGWWHSGWGCSRGLGHICGFTGWMTHSGWGCSDRLGHIYGFTNTRLIGKSFSLKILSRTQRMFGKWIPCGILCGIHEGMSFFWRFILYMFILYMIFGVSFLKSSFRENIEHIFI